MWANRLLLSGEGPAAWVGVHADVGVVLPGGGGGEQYEGGRVAGGAVGFLDKAAADAPALIAGIDGEVGEVAAVGEVSDGAGDADEAAGVARGKDDVGVAEHGVQAGEVLCRTALGQGGGDEDSLKLFGGEIGFSGVEDAHGGSLPARNTDDAARQVGEAARQRKMGYQLPVDEAPLFSGA